MQNAEFQVLQLAKDFIERDRDALICADNQKSQNNSRNFCRVMSEIYGKKLVGILHIE